MAYVHSEITEPTSITEKQYREAFFAIDRETGDHWLMWNDGQSSRVLFVGRDQGSLSQSESDLYSGDFNAKITEVEVIGEAGEPHDIEAIVFLTSESGAGIELDELAKGRVCWI